MAKGKYTQTSPYTLAKECVVSIAINISKPALVKMYSYKYFGISTNVQNILERLANKNRH